LDSFGNVADFAGEFGELFAYDQTCLHASQRSTRNPVRRLLLGIVHWS